MTPELLLAIIQQIAVNEPVVMDSLKKIFTKPDPTPADWNLERKRIQDMYYDKLVPAGALLSATTT